MKNDTGLALYQPRESDLRPDIFLPAPADNPNVPTWMRLRTEFPYIALRFKEKDSSGRHEFKTREGWQNTAWKITNPRTGQWAVAFLVDYGPHESTGRVVDLSPGLMSRLRLETDDEVLVDLL